MQGWAGEPERQATALGGMRKRGAERAAITRLLRRQRCGSEISNPGYQLLLPPADRCRPPHWGLGPRSGDNIDLTADDEPADDDDGNDQGSAIVLFSSDDESDGGGGVGGYHGTTGEDSPTSGPPPGSAPDGPSTVPTQSNDLPRPGQASGGADGVVPDAKRQRVDGEGDEEEPIPETVSNGSSLTSLNDID